jgi:lipopolysaccharide transport system ATP-binding protein
MSALAIRASGVGKRYRLGGLDRAVHFDTLRHALASLVHRRPDPRFAPGLFWALKDVTFDVRAGEVVGIIGHNGAGKSTLLKILSRITEPTEGEVEIAGRVGSLLEVGTGFHPELTGRENVYLNGAILGMRRAEIARKFDEIVSFAAIEKFLDTAVKFYSSGMYMRLAFAVAAHLEPDTLIVDEVLAVGDAAFQKKCLGKMGDVARHGRTVLFVSHNLGAIRSLCTRAVVLTEGALRFDGTADEAIAHYLANSVPGSEQDGQIRFGPDGLAFEDLRLHAVRVLDDAGEVRALFDATDSVCVEIEYEVLAPLRGARIVLCISTQEGELAFQSTDHQARDADQAPGRYATRCTIPGALLNRRMYVVEVGFEIPLQRILAPRRSYVSFTVSGGGNHGSTFPEAWPGVVCPSLHWVTERS